MRFSATIDDGRRTSSYSCSIHFLALFQTNNELIRPPMREGKKEGRKKGRKEGRKEEKVTPAKATTNIWPCKILSIRAPNYDIIGIIDGHDLPRLRRAST